MKMKDAKATLNQSTSNLGPTNSHGSPWGDVRLLQSYQDATRLSNYQLPERTNDKPTSIKVDPQSLQGGHFQEHIPANPLRFVGA